MEPGTIELVLGWFFRRLVATLTLTNKVAWEAAPTIAHPHIMVPFGSQPSLSLIFIFFIAKPCKQICTSEIISFILKLLLCVCDGSESNTISLRMKSCRKGATEGSCHRATVATQVRTL